MNKCGMDCKCKTRCPVRTIAAILCVSIILLAIGLVVGGCATGFTRDGKTVIGVSVGGESSSTVETVAGVAGTAANIVVPGSGGFVTEAIIGTCTVLGIGGAAASARKQRKQAEAKQSELDDTWDKWAEANAERAAAMARIDANAQHAITGGVK